MWMLDPCRDFVLIVGAPFIILPTLWLAEVDSGPSRFTCSSPRSARSAIISPT